MAQKTFGYTVAPNYARYAGTGSAQGVALALTMPETGKIVAIRLSLAKYASTAFPDIWGMIWARTAGTILSQSAAPITPTNVYVSGDSDSLDVYQITMPGTEIAEGTNIWAGFFKNSAEANHAPYWGIRQGTAYSYAEDDGSGATPVAFVQSRTRSGEALYVEVVYETGGEIKVFGTSFGPKPVKVWSGSAWVAKPVKHWNGSSWVESNS